MKNINSSINEFNEVWRKHLTLNKKIYILSVHGNIFIVILYKIHQKKLFINACKLSLYMVLLCSIRMKSNAKHIVRVKD